MTLLILKVAERWYGLLPFAFETLIDGSFLSSSFFETLSSLSSSKPLTHIENLCIYRRLNKVSTCSVYGLHTCSLFVLYTF